MKCFVFANELPLNICLSFNENTILNDFLCFRSPLVPLRWVDRCQRTLSKYPAQLVYCMNPHNLSGNCLYQMTLPVVEKSMRYKLQCLPLNVRAQSNWVLWGSTLHCYCSGPQTYGHPYYLKLACNSRLMPVWTRCLLCLYPFFCLLKGERGKQYGSKKKANPHA